MLPYLLAVAGGYLIGNSMNETTPQFGKGGKMDDKKAYADLDTFDLEGDKKLQTFLNKNHIKAKVLYSEKGEIPIVRYTGTKETLKKIWAEVDRSGTGLIDKLQFYFIMRY